MRLKAGVVFSVVPSVARRLHVIESIYERVCGREMVITSVSDGVHRAGSRHYTGEAFDIRTRDLEVEVVLSLVRELKAALGKSFDVVLEVDHVHVEYDPSE